MKRSAAFCRLVVAGMLLCGAASAERLRSPWDAVKVTSTGVPYACPPPPAFSKTLNAEGYYTDKQASVMDPKRLEAFSEASAGPTHLGQYASNAADAWLSKGSRAAAACVYSLLTAAAEADAWGGKMPQPVDVYLQNWMLSGTAIAYLKVRDSHLGTPAQDADIQRWFRLVAARVREYFDVQRGKPGSDAWNNHMYWAGLAVAAQGIANNDQDAFIWGMAAYRMGVDAVLPDGSLVAEMARGQMTLHYQLYALGPLIMLAELGEANGIDMYGAKEGDIHRLVKFDIAAMKDRSIITQRTGAEQDISKTYSGLEIGWAVPYVQRFPDAQLSAWIAQAPWVRFWQWGGAPPGATASATPESAADAAFRTRLQHSVEEGLAVQFPTNYSQSAAFFGPWCVMGDSTLHASISDKGDFIILTNEGGDASIGQAEGPIGIVAAGWQSMTGTLTPDGSQIDWSNGEYWARCLTGSAQSRLKLAGTWYPLGVRSLASSIQQRGDHLQLDNGEGGKGTGRIDAVGRLTTEWNGNRIDGVVTADGNHINWSNQTYWTRAIVYEPQKK